MPEDCSDYSGHITEWQYFKVKADAGEVFLRHTGFAENYRLKGYRFFNVQGQQRNLKECRAAPSIKCYGDYRL